MNECWKQQVGLTHDEKQAFVERVKAENVAFLGNLRTIHSQAENRMLTLVARERSGGTDEDDADDASVKRTIERCAESGVITLPPLVEVSNTGFAARDAEIASGLAPFEKAARVKNSCAGGAGCKIDVSRIG